MHCMHTIYSLASLDVQCLAMLYIHVFMAWHLCGSAFGLIAWD